MGGISQFNRVETLIARDDKSLFTLISYAVVLVIYANLNAFQQAILGTAASTVYFSINAVFLGHAFFCKEDPFFRLLLGTLLLIMLLGFVSWLAVIIYNLDVTRFTVVLFVTATICSLLNRKVKHQNGT